MVNLGRRFEFFLLSESPTQLSSIPNSNLKDRSITRLIDWLIEFCLLSIISFFAKRLFNASLLYPLRKTLQTSHSLQLKNTNWINWPITRSITHSFTRPHNLVLIFQKLCFPAINHSLIFYFCAWVAEKLKWTQTAQTIFFGGTGHRSFVYSNANKLTYYFRHWILSYFWKLTNNYK